MSQITFACGNCRAQMAVDSRLAGQTVQCQACGGLCELPKATPAMIANPQQEEMLALLRTMAVYQREIAGQAIWSARWGCLTAALVGVALVMSFLGGVAVRLR